MVVGLKKAPWNSKPLKHLEILEKKHFCGRSEGPQKFSQAIVSASTHSYCMQTSSPWLFVVLNYSQKKKSNNIFSSGPDLDILVCFEYQFLQQVWLYGAEIFITVSSCCSSATFIEQILKNSFFTERRWIQSMHI